MRLKIAARDRLPANTKYIFEIGDYVVFRDGRDGKRHDLYFRRVDVVLHGYDR